MFLAAFHMTDANSKHGSFLAFVAWPQLGEDGASKQM